MINQIQNQKIELNNYQSKQIQFYKKDNIYYLIFGGEFKTADESAPIIADLLKDLLLADKACEVHVFIQSYGGSVNCLNEIIEELRKFSNIVTICTSMAMSAGFLLWLLGNERYISPMAALMYHSMGWYGFVGDRIANIKNELESCEVRELIMQEYFSIKDYLTEEEIKKGRMTEVYFSGIEAIKRKWAKSYSEYQHRLTYGIVQDKDGSLWKSDENGIFVQYKKVPKSKKLTLPQLNGFI